VWTITYQNRRETRNSTVNIKKWKHFPFTGGECCGDLYATHLVEKAVYVYILGQHGEG
jgi:hypothetical protein